MELTGEVLGIIYQNEINSYTIAEIYANELEKIETIVGYLPFIAERSAAQRREAAIKKLPRKRKLALIEGGTP